MGSPVCEEQVTEHVAPGELVSVLKEFLPSFQGCYLYYPNRRYTSPALRALVDYLVGMKRRES